MPFIICKYRYFFNNKQLESQIGKTANNLPTYLIICVLLPTIAA